ncbi:hypothetical protein [Solihabitans fulvus]|uniref:hypothetical protein n=1 Tax=Solihabitans fulvus TaxID=1892852 RepID=UPI001661BB37|nr:hypothetical protein [Solihabitans fulvus]
MDIPLSHRRFRGRTALAAPGTRTGARGWPPAAIVLLGTLLSLFGLSWDVQWHVEVGPDTFFTLSHLALYSGSAIAGVASLVVVLRTTAAQRAGRAVDPRVGGQAVRVFGGVFAAPLGYLVSGCGAAMFLLVGLWDQWWHTLYGFDAVLDSPPHVALFLSISITMIGPVLTFAAARDLRWGRIGFLLSMPVLMAFSTVTVEGLSALPSIGVNPMTVGSAFLEVLLLVLAASCLRRPGATLVIGAVLGALQGILWLFSPWAASAYAVAVGLPLRDNVRSLPAFPSRIPLFLLVGAVAVELVLWLARRRGWSPRWVLPVAGGAAGVLLAGLTPVQAQLMVGFSGTALRVFVATTVAGGAFGALAGFLGWRFGIMTRAVGRPAAGTRQATEAGVA